VGPEKVGNCRKALEDKEQSLASKSKRKNKEKAIDGRFFCLPMALSFISSLSRFST
jgi:hypothetical protein